jgi:hypothetical protein
MAGAGAGGASDECSAPIDEAYCTTVTGHCAADTYTVEQCKAVAIAQRCGFASACIAEQDAVEQCPVTGTPVCDDAYTVISDIDCDQESAAFYDCVGYVWSCNNESTRCYCLHDARTRRTAPAPTCSIAASPISSEQAAPATSNRFVTPPPRSSIRGCRPARRRREAVPYLAERIFIGKAGGRQRGAVGVPGARAQSSKGSRRMTSVKPFARGAPAILGSITAN